MLNHLKFCIAFGLALMFSTTAYASESREFDSGWIFLKGDTAGAEHYKTDERAWQIVDLPHDWAIAGPFAEHAPATGSGGWLPTGVAWYRNHFTLPEIDKGKRVFIEFDGVMSRSGVWINGMHVGHRPSGYASFRYEITQHFRFGEDNVIAVRADTSAQPASRWYAGGGIYRHVRLITSGDIHVEPWGSFVTTPAIDAQRATINIESSVVNQSVESRSAYIDVDIRDRSGVKVATARSASLALPAGRAMKLAVVANVDKPDRWDIANPALYRAVIRIRAADGALLDEDNVTFGVREMRFVAATGFWLNGRNIKLKGAAIHADGGAFGMAVPLSFYERRLRGLQTLGVNAVRTAHHPFSPQFMDLCDRLGIIVMGEAFDMWTVAKNPQDDHLFFTDWSSLDLRDFIRRDRNHASLAIWSMGNEIHDTAYPVVAKSIIATLKKIANTEDPSRPVTMGLFRPNTTGDYANGLADMLDVVGQNYRENELAKAHADQPSRRIIGTENGKSRESWLIVRDDAAYAGMFLWTGADYLGEADRVGWPAMSRATGLVDRIDVPRPLGWERASWWLDKPIVEIARRLTEPVETAGLPAMVAVAMPQPKGPDALSDWTPSDLAPHPEKVEVYSNAAQVELFLAGKSLGRKPRNQDARAIAWDVAFQPGTISAIGYDADGTIIARDELRTAGAPAAIRLIPEQKMLAPGFDSIGFIRVEIVDARGVLVPAAGNALAVSVEGPGVLAAFDNASLVEHIAFDSPTRNAAHGRALIMVRATDVEGVIKVSVKSAGLKSAAVKIAARP